MALSSQRRAESPNGDSGSEQEKSCSPPLEVIGTCQFERGAEQEHDSIMVGWVHPDHLTAGAHVRPGASGRTEA